MIKRRMDRTAGGLLLQLLKIAVLAALRFGTVFHELEELLHAFANRGFEIELYPDTETRIALDHNSVEYEALHPDLAAGYPKTDLNVSPALPRRYGFDVATAHAGIRQVAPDGRFRPIHFQFDRDEALDARETPPVVDPRG